MNNAFALRLRNAAVNILPTGSFLRRDRKDALFITDAVRIMPLVNWAERLADAGFRVQEADGLLRLWPDATWLRAIAVDFPDPPDFFTASFYRFDTLAPDEESFQLFALGMRILDGDRDLISIYERRLCQCAAVHLRTGGGGGLYACALLSYLIKRSENA